MTQFVINQKVLAELRSIHQQLDAIHKELRMTNQILRVRPVPIPQVPGVPS